MKYLKFGQAPKAIESLFEELSACIHRLLLIKTKLDLNDDIAWSKRRRFLRVDKYMIMLRSDTGCSGNGVNIEILYRWRRITSWRVIFTVIVDNLKYSDIISVLLFRDFIVSYTESEMDKEEAQKEIEEFCLKPKPISQGEKDVDMIKSWGEL